MLVFPVFCSWRVRFVEELNMKPVRVRASEEGSVMMMVMMVEYICWPVVPVTVTA